MSLKHLVNDFLTFAASPVWSHKHLRPEHGPWGALGIAWCLAIFNAFTNVVFSSYAGVISLPFERFGSALGQMGVELQWPVTVAWYVGLAMKTVAFPFLLGGLILLWRPIIGAWAELFGKEVIATDSKIEGVLFGAISGMIFLAIPVFGGTLAFCAFHILLLVGLRERFNFGKIQSIIIVSTPFFILSLSFLVFVLLMVRLFAL